MTRRSQYGGPYGACRVNGLPTASEQFDGNMNELVMQKTNHPYGFAGQCGVNGVAAKLLGGNATTLLSRMKAMRLERPT